MSERRFGGTRGAALWLGRQLAQSFGGRATRMLDRELLQVCRHAKVMWSVSYFVVWVDCVSESSVLRYIEYPWAAVAG